MRLKEIKPGTAIHCSTIEEAKNLIELTNSAPAFLRSWGGEEVKTCYRMDNGKINGFSSAFYYKENGYEIVEFSDLIIPELTVEEVWSIASEISNMPKDIQKEIFPDFDYSKDDFWNQYAPYEVKRRIEQWKANHEKKEPEVEWYWQGRIFKVDENGCYYQVKDRTGFYDTGCQSRKSAEDYMADKLKEYCKTHEGNYIAKVEPICRVKAVE